MVTLLMCSFKDCESKSSGELFKTSLLGEIRRVFNAMVPKLDRRAISMQLFGKDFTMEQEKIAAGKEQRRMGNRPDDID